MGIFDSMKPKARPDFSNVKSGGSSTAPAAEPQADGDSSPPLLSADTYVVVEGDSLSRIAQRRYGDGRKWPRIYEANRDVIKDPDLIYPGQRLRMPQ